MKGEQNVPHPIKTATLQVVSRRPRHSEVGKETPRGEKGIHCLGPPSQSTVSGVSSIHGPLHTGVTVFCTQGRAGRLFHQMVTSPALRQNNQAANFKSNRKENLTVVDFVAFLLNLDF